MTENKSPWGSPDEPRAEQTGAEQTGAAHTAAETSGETPDTRPKPQYGELAPPGWTWEPPADDRISNDTASAAAAIGASEKARRTNPAPAPGAPGVRAVAPHPVDRLITIALLAMGAFFALPALFNAGSFGEMLDQQYAAFGLGKYGSPDLANALGLASGVLQTAIVALATWIAIPRLRAGKRAVLVPILGIVATVVVSLVIAAIAILGDPTFMSSVGDIATAVPTP